MNRKQRIKEINLVLNYSDKVYGSCTMSYIGCMADAELLRLVGGGEYGGLHRKSYSVLFAEATDKQIDNAHKYVTHWIPIAQEYMRLRARIGRAVTQFK